MVTMREEGDMERQTGDMPVLMMDGGKWGGGERHGGWRKQEKEGYGRRLKDKSRYGCTFQPLQKDLLLFFSARSGRVNSTQEQRELGSIIQSAHFLTFHDMMIMISS